ncbi:MAG: hypothetical protein MPJ50_15570 [Pirellulales bacterium]|nr:hypothetical protein [Pirellulales bacterium]
MLLITAEVALCLGVARVSPISFPASIMLGLVFLMLHVSQGELIFGIYAGALFGVTVPLTLVLGAAQLSFSDWFQVGLVIVTSCAAFGGAIHAVVSGRHLGGLPFLIIVVAFAFAIGSCLFLAFVV